MKNLMILTAVAVIPFTSYSRPLKSLLPESVSAITSCASLRGNWDGVCQEKDGDETRTYQSSYRVSQDGCHRLELMQHETAYEKFEVGRTNLTQHTEWGTFFNVTSYVNWSESGTKLNIKDHYSGEFAFEGGRRITSGKREAQIKLLDGGNISFSMTESSSSSPKDESISRAYEASLECSYKLTR